MVQLKKSREFPSCSLYARYDTTTWPDVQPAARRLGASFATKLDPQWAAIASKEMKGGSADKLVWNTPEVFCLRAPNQSRELR